MVENGKYAELLERSSSFSRLLENIHQRKQEPEHADILPMVVRRLSSRCATVSERENEDDSIADTDMGEEKGEGTVKSYVYLSYIRAGVPLALGVTLLVFVFCVREIAFVLFNRWLADWNDDETHRHRQFPNCSTRMTEKISRIRAMNDVEWTNHRNYRFYVFAGVWLSCLLEYRSWNVFLSLQES